MADFTSHRREWIRYDLLDLADRGVVVDLGGILPDGTLTGSTDAAIRWSGSTTSTVARDWVNRRLRVWYERDGYEPTPLMTAIVDAPDRNLGDSVTEYPLELLDKTSLLAGDDFGENWGYDAGTSIISTVRDIIASVGDAGAVVVIPDSDMVLSESKVWESDADKLTIVNDLLAVAAYRPLYCDGLGRYRSEPISDEQGVAWTFEYGEASVYEPAVAHSLETYRVPNRVRCVQSTDGEVPPATAVATDEDPASPWSYPGRPWKTVTYRDVDVGEWPTTGEAFAALQAEAARRLAAAQRRPASITLSHQVLPGVKLDARVRFEHPDLGGVTGVVTNLGVTGVVAEQRIDLAACRVESKIGGVS